MRLTSCILAFILLGLGCSREPAIIVRFEPPDLAGRDLSQPRDAALPVDLASVAVDHSPKDKLGPACTSEAECTLITGGCCDCTNGGTLKSVLKRDEPKFLAAQRATCKGVMCTMMVGSDKLCGKRPACVSGHCGIRAARPDEQRGLPLPGAQ